MGCFTMMVTVPSVITADQTGLRILPGVTSILETDLTARKSAAISALVSSMFPLRLHRFHPPACVSPRRRGRSLEKKTATLLLLLLW